LRKPGGAAVYTHYLPFGGYRGTAPNQTITDRDFTGQRENMELGLLYYQARYYLPGVGRFISADTLVPDKENPQAYNRYSYVANNPLKYVDPDGHCWGVASFIRDWNVSTSWGTIGGGTNCANIDTALQLVTNPDVPVEDRVLPATVVGGFSVATVYAAAGTGLLICSKIPICLEIATALLSEAENEGLIRDLENNETGHPLGTPRNLPGPEASQKEIQKSLGPDWSPPINPNANWHNTGTGESLRPDPDHTPPIGPHWDYNYRDNPNPNGWRIYPDGRVEPKWQ
jgi:RHS repeat-associated protein